MHGYYRQQAPSAIAPFAGRRHAPSPRPELTPGLLARVLLTVRTRAEGHVVGAYFLLVARGEEATYATLAEVIGDELGEAVELGYVKRGLRDAVRNGTLLRCGRGAYEPGPKLADLVGSAPWTR